MAVYFIGSFDVADPQEYEGYVPGVVPLLEKHGAEVLVADYDPQSLEGEARGVNVVFRFESEEQLLGFYNDPEYEPLKNQRIRASANRLISMAKEFVSPSESR